jgi:hypothetical protein
VYRVSQHNHAIAQAQLAPQVIIFFIAMDGLQPASAECALLFR